MVWRAPVAAQDDAPAHFMPVEVPASDVAALPAREALFERLKADLQVTPAGQEQPASVEADLGEVAEPTEWPIAPLVDEEPPMAAVEPEPETAPAREPVEEITISEAPDFMDEEADGDDWNDFPDLRGRSAYA